MERFVLEYNYHEISVYQVIFGRDALKAYLRKRVMKKAKNIKIR